MKESNINKKESSDFNKNIEDDYPQMSPLCQTVTRDGKTVEIFIYYAEDKNCRCSN